MSDIMQDKTYEKKDAAMVGRAIKQRWPIPEDLKAEVIAEARRMLTDQSADRRARAAAMKIVIESDKLNQADEHLAAKNERLDGGKPTEAQKITVEYVNKLPEIE